MSLLKAAASGTGILYVDDVFSTYVYTGNGATQTITNGIDLAGKGGLVWVKNRTTGNPHLLQHQAGYGHNSNTTTSYQTLSDAPAIWNSDGFTNTYGGGNTNATNERYASWTFRKAAKFFDVVTYTGDGINGKTILHSLGINPGMIIVKRTDVNSTIGWAVYHRSATDNLCLNSTLAQGITFGQDIRNVTLTTFDVSAYKDVNAVGGTYVAYLYAHDTSSTGIIQCGSFVDNSTTTINLGWEPQFILAKESTRSNGWHMLDIARGMTANGYTSILQPDTSYQEIPTTYQMAFPRSTGFAWQTGQLTESGNTVVYMAIRRPNKPPTTGTQVFEAAAYTGNGSAGKRNIGTLPIDLLFHLERNLVFNTSDSHDILSRLTGNNAYMHTNSTAAEASPGAGVFAFDSSTVGFILDGGINTSYFNKSGTDYITYLFKRAPGFFDVVCYTGNQTWIDKPHNLGVVPELIIAKNRNSTQEWMVWQPKVAPCPYWVLNTTAATATINGDRTATTTTFSTMYDSNSFTYVAYLFATLAGISKVGSYTGNGSSQNIDCGFGSKYSAFVLIKRTDSTGDWYVWDTARGIATSTDPHLSLNNATSEVTTDNSVDLAPCGFTVIQNSTTNINVNNGTYIYLSITSGSNLTDAVYTVAGTYSWIAPADVTSVCVVAVGGGGGGNPDNIPAGALAAGGGGGLGWKNNISVTPGQTYTVVVGAGGIKAYNDGNTSGSASYFINSSTVAGNGGQRANGGTGGAGGTFVGDGGGNGGQGGNGSPTSNRGGGGGAGGYSGTGGAGGNGGGSNGSAGSGGAAGGGYGAGSGGGGVGLYGQGTSGIGGVPGEGGGGGSGGTSGSVSSSGPYGGGGTGLADSASGAVRIIWGTGRSFPSNAA